MLERKEFGQKVFLTKLPGAYKVGVTQVTLTQGALQIPLQWSGLQPMSALKSLSVDPLLHPFDLPAWVWFQDDQQGLMIDTHASACTLSDEIPFTAAGEIRFWKYRDHVTIDEAVQEVFPFRTVRKPFVTSPVDVPVDGSAFPSLGSSYHVEFWPQPFQIHPFGVFLLDPLASVFQVQQLLSNIYAGGRNVIRVLANGKTIHEDVLIVVADAIGPLRARFFCLPGGAPGTLAAISEQLQSLLVAHGHPSSTVKAQANHVLDKIGQKRCRQVLDSKAVWPTLKHDASAAGIVLIPAEHRPVKETKTDIVFDTDPWAKYSKAGPGDEVPNESKRRTRKQNQVARVDLSFFHAGQQPLQQIEFAQLLQGWPGIHVVRFEEFADLDTVTRANLCAAASGVLIVGAAGETISERFPSKAENILVPGWLQNHPVALRCTLVQTGDEKVETRSTAVLAFQETVSNQSVVQVHIYKNEAGEKWNVLSTEGISTFLKQLGFSLDAIAQTWSQAFFKGGKKVGAVEADYYHGFVKVENGKLDAILRLGGMTGFYPNPRGADKGPDVKFRSVLLRGHTLQEARSVQATVPNSFGLTRSKHGIGIRVLSKEYKALKKKIFPQAAESSDSDEGGPRRFQMLGVPDDCTRSTLKQALKALNWPVKVLRSAGIRAWTITIPHNPLRGLSPLKDRLCWSLNRKTGMHMMWLPPRRVGCSLTSPRLRCPAHRQANRIRMRFLPSLSNSKLVLRNLRHRLVDLRLTPMPPLQRFKLPFRPSRKK